MIIDMNDYNDTFGSSQSRFSGVATTLFFSHLVENVMTHLLGLPPHDKKKSTANWCSKMGR